MFAGAKRCKGNRQDCVSEFVLLSRVIFNFTLSFVG